MQWDDRDFERNVLRQQRHLQILIASKIFFLFSDVRLGCELYDYSNSTQVVMHQSSTLYKIISVISLQQTLNHIRKFFFGELVKKINKTEPKVFVPTGFFLARKDTQLKKALQSHSGEKKIYIFFRLVSLALINSQLKKSTTMSTRMMLITGQCQVLKI